MSGRAVVRRRAASGEGKGGEGGKGSGSSTVAESRLDQRRFSVEDGGMANMRSGIAIREIERPPTISKGDATAEAILVAAIEVFARSGFEASSTRTIAMAANVHHALLRHYFGDKNGLWQAAVREMFRRQHDEFQLQQERHPISINELDGLKEFVRRYIRYCAAHPEHAQILVHEAIADTARLDWAIQEFVRAKSQQIVTALEQQTTAGNLRLDDAMMSSILLSAASQMVFVLSSHLRRVFDQDVRDPAFVERIADSVVALIFVR